MREIYIEEIEIIGGVEHRYDVKISTIIDEFIAALDIKHLYDYLDVSGTILLEHGGSTISSHHVRVNGDTTLDLSDLHDNATVYLMIEQDSVGGHIVNIPAFSNLSIQPIPSQEANAMDVAILMKMHSSVHLHSYIKPTFQIGNSGSYIYDQAPLGEAATWQINHKLGKFPSVTIVDPNGHKVMADIQYIDANNVTIRFSSAFMGKAYFN